MIIRSITIRKNFSKQLEQNSQLSRDENYLPVIGQNTSENLTHTVRALTDKETTKTT